MAVLDLPIEVTTVVTNTAADAADTTQDQVRSMVTDRYQVIRPLGQGGMGIVYEAWDRLLRRRVALKLIRRETAQEAAAAARLVREARVMASLEHDHVVSAYDVGTWEGRVFIAMQMIEGMTLRHWAQAAPRSNADKLRVLIGAGRGLAAAHARHIVHRDFKPDNVLVDVHGVARVTDFGIARQLDRTEPEVVPGVDPLGDTQLTQSGALLGTPAYMAPEQALGGTVTAKADQFSFCVAAWELFAGKRPFAGSTVAEVLSNKVAGQVEPADTDRWPEGLEPVLRRGLTVEPAGRYPSLEALLLVLDEIAKAKPQRRRRRTIQLAAVFGGAFSAGALTLVIASSGPSSSPSTAAPAAPPVAQAIQVEAIEVPAPASPAPTAAPIVVAEPAKSIEPAREPARVSRASSRKGRAKTASRAVASVQPAAQLAVPAVAETVAPPTPRTEVAPPAPDVSAIRASVDRELKAVDQARTARALLIADISGYGADREQALAAAARGDSAGAHEHVEAMRAKLGAVQIDSQFVNAKMMMLGARREKVQLTDAQDEEFKKRLHSATKADSPEAVNRHLTAVGNLLGMR